MNTIASDIIEFLNDDIVSHGLLVQCIDEYNSLRQEQQILWESVLAELLASDVEIGMAILTLANSVEFVAWRGSIIERISKAVECVNKAVPSDKEFAYWLCLRKNVDRYEGET